MMGIPLKNCVTFLGLLILICLVNLLQQLVSIDYYHHQPYHQNHRAVLSSSWYSSSSSSSSLFGVLVDEDTILASMMVPSYHNATASDTPTTHNEGHRSHVTKTTTTTTGLSSINNGSLNRSMSMSIDDDDAAAAAAAAASSTNLPTEDDTVLAMIVFGNATHQNHVQRCIRSARMRGEWKGRIVILTDSTSAFQELVAQDPLIHVLHPRRQDFQDLPEFRHEKMKFKRFKTLLIDYIVDDISDHHPDLENVETILYVDIDIVVGKPILPWLQQKWMDGLEKMSSTAPDVSMMWMFDTPQGFGKAAHSGVILLNARRSRGCLQQWRDIFDEQRLDIGRDQKLLRNMRRKDHDETKCRISVWPNKHNRKGDEILFPMPADFVSRKVAQFVHITNTFHAAKTDAQIQKTYLEDILNLTTQERQSPDSLAIVPEGF